MDEIDMRDRVCRALYMLDFMRDAFSMMDQLSDRGRAGAAEILDHVAAEVAEAVGVDIQPRVGLAIVA